MPSFYVFLIWVVIAIVFVVIELFTFSFVLIFFGFGALVAGVCALLFNLALGWQIVIFIIVSLVSLFLLRRFSIKTFRGRQTNDAGDDYHKSIIGQTATVTKAIVPPATGEVKYSGSFWPAVANDPIEAGAVVEIMARDNKDSFTLNVKAL